VDIEVTTLNENATKKKNSVSQNIVSATIFHYYMGRQEEE
jgi:hypothetical protein